MHPKIPQFPNIQRFDPRQQKTRIRGTNLPEFRKLLGGVPRGQEIGPGGVQVPKWGGF
jgi:hypothetical protein